MKRINNKLAKSSSDIHHKYTATVKEASNLRVWNLQGIIETGAGLTDDAMRLLQWKISTKFSQTRGSI